MTIVPQFLLQIEVSRIFTGIDNPSFADDIRAGLVLSLQVFLHSNGNIIAAEFYDKSATLTKDGKTLHNSAATIYQKQHIQMESAIQDKLVKILDRDNPYPDLVRRTAAIVYLGLLVKEAQTTMPPNAVELGVSLVCADDPVLADCGQTFLLALDASRDWSNVPERIITVFRELHSNRVEDVEEVPNGDLAF